MKQSSGKQKPGDLRKELSKAKLVTGNPVTEIHLPFVLRFCYPRVVLASTVP